MERPVGRPKDIGKCKNRVHTIVFKRGAEGAWREIQKELPTKPSLSKFLSDCVENKSKTYHKERIISILLDDLKKELKIKEEAVSFIEVWQVKCSRKERTIDDFFRELHIRGLL